MEIEYVNGNVIECKELIMLHGCNAQGAMGRGVAKAVREHFPWAYDAYRKAYIEQVIRPKFNRPMLAHMALGTVSWAINVDGLGRPLIVGNLITQIYYEAKHADKDGRLVDYGGVRLCMREVEQFVRLTHDRTIDIHAIGIVHRVALPKIGAGLGGGDWTIISKIIEDESKNTFRPVVYCL